MVRGNKPKAMNKYGHGSGKTSDTQARIGQEEETVEPRKAPASCAASRASNGAATRDRDITHD